MTHAELIELADHHHKQGRFHAGCVYEATEDGEHDTARGHDDLRLWHERAARNLRATADGLKAACKSLGFATTPGDDAINA